MTTSTKPAEEPVLEIYPALSAALNTKADIIDHLRNVHGVTYVHNNSITGTPKNVKATIDQMIAAHAQIHLRLDSPETTWKWTENAIYDRSTSTWAGTWQPYDKNGNVVANAILPHKHAGLEDSTDLRAAATAARTGQPISDKPLPPTQLRLLTEIVKQDFRILEEEMREFAQESLEGRIKEVRAEFATREGDAPKMKSKAERIYAKAIEQLRTLRDEAAEAGIELSVPSNPAVVKYSVKGINEAIKTAQDENRSALSRALSRLEREKAVSLRRVQLAGISPEAVKLLDEMPDARQMLLAAQAEKPKELGATPSPTHGGY